MTETTLLHSTRLGRPALPEMKRACAGFTLIELLVVLAVIALLVAIALPSYTMQVRRATRSEAKTALLDIASAQERFLYSYGRYSASLTGARGSNRNSGLALADTTSSGDGDSAYYDMTLSVDEGGLGYEVSASPQGRQAADDCGTFRLTHNGERSADRPGCW